MMGKKKKRTKRKKNPSRGEQIVGSVLGIYRRVPSNRTIGRLARCIDCAIAIATMDGYDAGIADAAKRDARRTNGKA